MTRLENTTTDVIEPEAYSSPSGEVAVTRFKVTPVHIVLIVVSILTLLFMMFITLAKSIELKAYTPDLENPSELLPLTADLRLQSMLALPIGNRVLVLPGSHKFIAQAGGYKMVSDSITVEAERQQTFEVLMKPLPGSIIVTNTSGIPASVAIDGAVRGSTNIEIHGIEAGLRLLTIDAPLYRSQELEFLVQGRGQQEQVSVTLEPAWGTLTVEVKPVGTQVFIDEELVGETPLTVKVEEGLRTLKLEAEKHQSLSREFSISVNEELTVDGLELRPSNGIVSLNSNPPEAAVIVDGAYRGTSPIKLEIEPFRDRTIQVFKAGFKLQEEVISAQPEEELQLQVALQQDLTKVTFSITPDSAELVIDGVSRGRGSRTQALSTLPHQILVRKPGYVDYRTTLIPTRAGEQVVSIKLLTKEQKFWSQQPNQYVTSGGQTMKLFKSPGEVQLGSSRKENGRRSNEVMHRAELTKHFYVSLHEVSNKQYRRFDPAHSSGNYKGKSLDSGRHPAVNISWQRAALYCNWLSRQEGLDEFYRTKSGFVSGHVPEANGYRLLTEAEWAWLARNKGNTTITYSWGDTGLPTQNKVGNFADRNAVELVSFVLRDYDDGYSGSAPIGKYPPNHRGLYDMEGNAAEWVNDWYGAKSELAGTPNKVLTDPLGPEEGEFHVIRGASWARGYPPQLRLAYRDFGAKGTHDVGFRIARYVGSPK